MVVELLVALWLTIWPNLDGGMCCFLNKAGTRQNKWYLLVFIIHYLLFIIQAGGEIFFFFSGAGHSVTSVSSVRPQFFTTLRADHRTHPQ